MLHWAISAQYWRKQRLLAALGRALLKLLSRHKLLVSDQVLCLQCKVYSSLVLFCCYDVMCSFPDLNLKQQFQVVNSILLHFILEEKKDKQVYYDILFRCFCTPWTWFHLWEEKFLTRISDITSVLTKLHGIQLKASVANALNIKPILKSMFYWYI